MDSDLSPPDVTVGVDYDSGDAVVYSGGGAASYYRGEWHPGRVFSAEDLFSRDSRFSAVDDPDEVRRYRDAAHDALLTSRTAENDAN